VFLVYVMWVHFSPLHCRFWPPWCLDQWLAQLAFRP
jgi:hypothetical protein